MKRIAVESSNLASVGYDEAAKMLEIQFHSGGIYQYDNVKKEFYDELMKAESKGRYFLHEIKGVYSYRRVR
ncbi:MAG: KTSC domain-containing protein [Blastocatellia bacterium]|nr:KTSC domain-containing protein [Blastocatellia bacterium]